MIFKPVSGKQFKVHFILFLLSYAVNPLILYFIPVNISIQFLQGFTIANVVFSLLFTYLFSNIEKIKDSQKALKYIFYTVLGVCLLQLISNATYAISIIYPFSLLYCDYAVTQGVNERSSIAYRMFLMASGLIVVAIVYFYKAYFIECMLLRSGLILLYGYSEVCTSSFYSNLKIKYATSFILNTYIFYSGALFLLVYLNETGSTGTKHWYIALQLALGLLLKLLDFSIRKNSEINTTIIFAVFGGACGAVGLVTWLHASIINFMISVLAVLGLLRLLLNLKHE